MTADLFQDTFTYFDDSIQLLLNVCEYLDLLHLLERLTLLDLLESLSLLDRLRSLATQKSDVGRGEIIFTTGGDIYTIDGDRITKGKFKNI